MAKPLDIKMSETEARLIAANAELKRYKEKATLDARGVPFTVGDTVFVAVNGCPVGTPREVFYISNQTDPDIGEKRVMVRAGDLFEPPDYFIAG